jgi:hypothetical protein
VENVFFEEEALPGTYEFWAHYYSGSGAADFELEVAVDGRVERSVGGTLTGSGEESERYTFDY